MLTANRIIVYGCIAVSLGIFISSFGAAADRWWCAEQVLGAKKIDLSRIYGRIQYVDSFPDFKIEVVTSFPDLKVQEVSSFPDAPGKWQIVTSFPDYKIQKVSSFGDFKVQYVSSFPGVAK